MRKRRRIYTIILAALALLLAACQPTPEARAGAAQKRCLIICKVSQTRIKKIDGSSRKGAPFLN